MPNKPPATIIMNEMNCLKETRDVDGSVQHKMKGVSTCSVQASTLVKAKVNSPDFWMYSLGLVFFTLFFAGIVLEQHERFHVDVKADFNVFPLVRYEPSIWKQVSRISLLWLLALMGLQAQVILLMGFSILHILKRGPLVHGLHNRRFDSDFLVGVEKNPGPRTKSAYRKMNPNRKGKGQKQPLIDDNPLTRPNFQPNMRDTYSAVDDWGLGNEYYRDYSEFGTPPFTPPPSPRDQDPSQDCRIDLRKPTEITCPIVEVVMPADSGAGVFYPPYAPQHDHRVQQSIVDCEEEGMGVEDAKLEILDEICEAQKEKDSAEWNLFDTKDGKEIREEMQKHAVPAPKPAEQLSPEDAFIANAEKHVEMIVAKNGLEAAIRTGQDPIIGESASMSPGMRFKNSPSDFWATCEIFKEPLDGLVMVGQMKASSRVWKPFWIMAAKIIAFIVITITLVLVSLGQADLVNASALYVQNYPLVWLCWAMTLLIFIGYLILDMLFSVHAIRLVLLPTRTRTPRNDYRPIFDKQDRLCKTVWTEYQLLVEVTSHAGYAYFSQWYVDELPAMWFSTTHLKSTRSYLMGDIELLDTLELDGGLLTIALNRKTMMGSRDKAGLTLEAMVRLIQQNPHYQEDHTRLLHTGKSMYRDMCRVCGAIVTRSVYTDHQLF